MGEQETNATTIAGALKGAASVLGAAGVTEPRREAASLLMHATGRDRAFLFAHDGETLDTASVKLFRASVARRAAGEPLQYITGRQEFYGLEFEVTPDVLIPRPETELLVETALELLKGREAPLICDVGVGSGCIVITLLHERRDACALGLDISEAALAIAARNAARHGVSERLTLLASDCFAALDESERAGARFSLIVSNPPYVVESDMEVLQREVREHEPRVALTPGGDGLSIIRRVIDESPRHLARGGHLLLEIGFNQHEQVARLINPHTWTLLRIHKDLQGIPRTVALQLTP